MEIKETQAKSRPPAADRIALKKESMERLNQWTSQVADNFKALRIKPADLVEWLIKSHPATLSVDELEKIKTDHFDEVRFAAWALKEIKTAKARGENLSLADLVAQMGKEIGS